MKKLKVKTKLSYATGNLGYGVISQTMTTFIMFFGTSVLGIKGSLVGLCVALSAFWDGLSDPIVGYLSDLTKSKFWGRRLGYLFFGTLGMIVFNILLWSVPSSLSQIGKFFWLLVTLLGLETANTCFATPYVALGIDIAPGYNEQSTVQGYKTVFFITGMVLPSILMMIFMPASAGQMAQLKQSGYVYISYVTSLLSLICGLICVFGTKQRVNSLPLYKTRKKEKNAFFKIFYNFFITLKQKNYGSIIISYSVALISAAFLTSVGMHLFTYCFHFNSIQIPILMTGLFLGAIFSQPYWIYLSKRIDKKPALKRAYLTILIGIFLTFWVFVFRNNLGVSISFWIILVLISFCGFGTGALYSLPISMFADNVTMDKIRDMIDVNTIIGNPITTNDGTTIIPVSKVTYGFASGGSDFPSKSNQDIFGGGGGAGVTIMPIAFLVIDAYGNVDIKHITAFDNAAERIVGLVPEMFDKVSNAVNKAKMDKAFNTAVAGVEAENTEETVTK